MADQVGKIIQLTQPPMLETMFKNAASGQTLAEVVPVQEFRTVQADNERLRREVCSEREGRERLATALREKDAAMGVLFERLAKAGVDCSDLIP